MCHDLKILAKSNRGELSICLSCNIYHLEFNNLYFEFSTEEFVHFKTYILSVDCMYWECAYAETCFKRKIPIPSVQKNLILLFSRQEIEELKALVMEKDDNHYLELDDIEYTYCLN
ncbi:MAG: DUF6686 family protein [Flavobacteriaceae bacterium]